VPSPEPNSPAERALVEQLAQAFETNDVDGVISLMSDDVWLRLPPIPLEYQGRDLAARFLAVVAFRPGRSFRLVATRANCQPAFGVYVSDPYGDIFHANGLFVLTLVGSQICELTRFDNNVLPAFGLPRTLPP
jgi:RNA polymerase sigma-70 factor (ECF subfamily)